MTVKNLSSRIRDLPTFTYSKIDRNAAVARRTRHKAVSIYKGKKDYTRHITEHHLDPKRWVDETPPSWWPAELQFPGDYLKAVMYSRKGSKRSPNKGPSRKQSPPRARSHAVGEFCRTCESCGATATRIDRLCVCTTTPWDAKNTKAWSDENIDLRWVGDDKGIGAYVLRSIKKGTVLGEHLGELLPYDQFDSTYMFDVTNDEEEKVVFIDSLRMGNWVRYINHSCDANTEFVAVRVGQGMRYLVKATRWIGAGQEVTVDYSHGYWDELNRKRIWCSCGAEGCRFGDPAGRSERGVEELEDASKRTRRRRA